jgi:hypothetical protein
VLFDSVAMVRRRLAETLAGSAPTWATFSGTSDVEAGRQTERSMADSCTMSAHIDGGEAA